MFTPKNIKIVCFLALLIYKTSGIFSQCVPSGASVPVTITNNTLTGSVGWSNLVNGLSSDNAYISCSTLLGILGSAQSHYIATTSYGFAIPLTATVCGIEARVERHAVGLLIGSSVTDKNVYIVKGGTMVGTNHASGAGWPGSDAFAVYGSNSDLWGTTWTPANINANNFGLGISAQLNAGLVSLFLTANVDMVSITVYYTTKVLPVELVSFTGELESQTIKLEWQTATEKNNHYFEVEKMDKGYNWNMLDRIPGNGNSSVLRSYSTYDHDPADINYYRLKQVDYSNHSTYSDIISVEYDLGSTELTMYPVPATNYITIDAPYKIEHVEIVSDKGAVSIPEILSANPFKINTSNLSAGIYLVKITSAKETLVKKFIKE